MTNGNGGNGHQKRIVTYGFDNPDLIVRVYAVGQDGYRIDPDRFITIADRRTGDLTLRYEWLGLPPDAILFRVTRFIEGRGYWMAMQLPPAQTDEMIQTVAALTTIHGVAFVAGLGMPKKWSKGARR